MEYYKLLEARVLEHRYRYYVLDAPVLLDFEYDFLERTYIAECYKAGQSPVTDTDGIGWSDIQPDYVAAKLRVDNGTDYYSLWLKDMKPVWLRLGLPNHGQVPKHLTISLNHESIKHGL